MVTLDRAAMGWLLLVWEPVFLLTLAVWVRQYGMGSLMPYVLFALVLACAFGCLTAPEQIATILRTGTAPGLPGVMRAP